MNSSSGNRFYKRSALLEQLIPNPAEGKVRAIFGTGRQAMIAKTAVPGSREKKLPHVDSQAERQSGNFGMRKSMITHQSGNSMATAGVRHAASSSLNQRPSHGILAGKRSGNFVQAPPLDQEKRARTSGRG